ncbi:MAG: phosphatase PAP2 family protein [Ruminococcus sp.]|nr:phosphatase PAP2 family protein [Ruminococcus sp.]
MNDDRRKINIRIAVAAAGICLFAGLLIWGTSADRSISDTLYSDNNLFCYVMALIGPMPVFFVTVPLAGALLQRSLGSGFGKGVKLLLTIIAAALVIGLSFYGAKAFTSSDCLDSIYPSAKNNMALIIPIIVCVFIPLGFLGLRLAAKNTDTLLVKRIVMVLIAICFAYAAQEILKGMMRRPRYRTAIKGYEGVGFVNWYEKFPYTKELPAALGIAKEEFASFPSGHSMMSMTSFIGLPALAMIVPAFRGKEVPLALCGFGYSCIVMFSRILAGAHYLSDVAASGLIMLTVSAVYLLILKTTVKADLSR